MKKLAGLFLIFCLCCGPAWVEPLQYHQIRVDESGKIIPWYSPDLGVSYDFCLRKIWHFWDTMKECPNGVKYFMQHQVWKPDHDRRGLGGDQLAMALSSWSLLYPYLGDTAVVDNMEYIADYYIDHGFSKPDCAWPNLPYPYNTDIHSGIYDGDMRAGKGVLQPDKAGAFGAELVTLYKITGKEKYLKTAIGIADTLAKKIQPGDEEHSPWPFRVQAITGDLADEAYAPYTSNWTGTMRLFENLILLNQGDSAAYQKAWDQTKDWLKTYPMKTDNWGPFFEDVKDYSNTQINADTLAWYILMHPDWDAEHGPEQARAILDWTQKTFGNPSWEKYGVFPINEQTAYKVPGNSHTSRHASVELIYAEKTGDSSRKEQSIRQLNWATYMVDFDGKNRYYHDDVWLTDGYGDYVRHYLRAIAAAPELSPSGQNHLLESTSVIRSIQYTADKITYKTFDPASVEKLRIAFEPEHIMAGEYELQRLDKVSDLQDQEGYTFNAAGDIPGVLRIAHENSGTISIGRKSLLEPR